MDYELVIKEKKPYTPILEHLCVGDCFRFKDPRLDEALYRVVRDGSTFMYVDPFNWDLYSFDDLLKEEVLRYRLDSVHVTEI